MTIGVAPTGDQDVPVAPVRSRSRLAAVWPWGIVLMGSLYFFAPLAGTIRLSLQGERGTVGLAAYQQVIDNPQFFPSLGESLINAVLTIVVGLVVIVPTSYWVTLRMPRLRPVIEFITLLPFVIPGVVLVFALIRLYSRPPLLLTSTYFSTRAMMICAYAALSFPYIYRSVDNGLRAIDVRSLTEAAQSLGARWPTILFRVVFPNLRVALLSGALLGFAIVLGELTIALYLGQHTLGPFMADIVRNKPFQAAALTLMAFTITWLAMGLIAVATRDRSKRR